MSSVHGGSSGPRERDVRMAYGSATREGSAHDNEDRFFVIDDLSATENAPPVSFTETVAYAAVFDGHGGERCSDYLSKALHRKIILNDKYDDFVKSSETALLESFKEAEDEFCEMAERQSETSGSCAVACLVNGLDVFVAHCGDCRAVVRTSDKKVNELTIDHRPGLPSEKARIRAAGGTIRGGRVQGVLAPSRSFGDIDVKLACPGPVVIAEPDVSKHTIDLGKHGHAFMVLATDGVWDAMATSKAMDIVAKSLHKHGDPEIAANTLADASAALNSDDVTCIVMTFTDLNA